MQNSDVRLISAVLGNISLNGVWIFVQKIQPLLAFLLIVLQLVAAGATVWHLIKKAKREKNPTPSDPGL
jgi:hypothetical protein